MGLDMYLTARLYTSEMFSPEAYVVVKPALEESNLFIPPQYINGSSDHIQIELPVGYWRKANHIHGWFVTEVQGGTDDCGDYSVEVDKLRELAKLCSEVAASNSPAYAAEHMPCASGFFFGNDNYDKYYFDSLRDTLAGLEKLLADVDAGKLEGWEFYYHSSW